MDIVRYRYMFMIVLIILVQMSDGRPVADKVSLPLIKGTAAFPSGLNSSGTVSSAQLSRSDSDTTVAISTVVGIVVLLALFIGIQSFLWSVACHKVDIFTTMKCSVHHPCLVVAPQPTALGLMSRPSSSSTSLISDISSSSVPMKKICQPAPVLIKDTSPVRH